MLIVFAGLPGSGKTTLALRLSKVIGAVFLRIDSIEQALGSATAPSGEIGEAGYRVGYAIARDNLCVGRSVVADSVNPLQATRDTWRAVGDDAGVNVVEVEVMCSDSAEHRRRVESRATDLTGLVLPTWKEVVSREYHPWNREHIVVDTAGRSVEQNLGELLARLKRSPEGK